VRYTGLTGVEWQGWLRAKETGRYELGLDGNTVNPNTINTATCLFTGWLEDRSIGLQLATANAGPAEAAVLQSATADMPIGAVVQAWKGEEVARPAAEAFQSYTKVRCFGRCFRAAQRVRPRHVADSRCGAVPLPAAYRHTKRTP
jgi:hypothetical protein